MDMHSFTDIKRQNMAAFRRIIEDGQQQGVFRTDVNILLIPPTIMGTILHFRMNRTFLGPLLGLDTDEQLENYISNELTQHIKQTIKALLVHEN